MYQHQSLCSSQGRQDSLLGSAYTSQLHENSLKAYKRLQKLKEENDHISQVKLKLEAEVHEYSKKITQVVNSNMALENLKCDLQLQVSRCTC